MKTDVRRIHGAKSTAMLLGAGSLCGYFAYAILSNNPNDEGVVWGLGLGVFAALCLYSGFRARS